MKNISNLSDYLRTQGVNDSTPAEEVAVYKRAYWKAYHKHYYQERKKQQHRLTLRLTKNEYRRFKVATNDHQLGSMNTFIKQVALAYLDKGYVPRHIQGIEKLSREVNAIGNNINQVVHTIHRTRKRDQLTGAYDDEKVWQQLQDAYSALAQQVVAMEEKVQVYMKKPPVQLSVALSEFITAHPERVGELQELIASLAQQAKHAND